MGNTRQPVIAVDGYSSCGKSTFARMIAQELGYIYIDSGAMYRAVALYCLENGIISKNTLDLELLQRSLDLITIELKLNPHSGVQETWLNGRNVAEEIRSIAVAEVVSAISQVKTVREKMVTLQRKIGENGGVVMDGRDIGTIVFPEARLKIFMTADPDIRAKRRFDELIQKGVEVELSAVARNVRMRDHEDENRKESPLVKAGDAFVLDNSYMTPDQQMDWFREKWNKSKYKNER